MVGQSELTVPDLDLIGKLAFNRGFYDRATEWLDAAVWKAVRAGMDKEVIQKLRNTLKTVQNKHDQVEF